jgi:hypothetical protein
MKPVTYLFLGVCLSFVACLGYFSWSRTGSAQRQTRSQWEYAAITSAYSFSPSKDKTNKISGMAAICYLQATGCRFAETKHELDYGAFLQDRQLPLLDAYQTRKEAGVKASEIAFQKAVAQLGSEGWEIVSEPNLEFEFVNYDDYVKFEDKSVLFQRANTKAVYFKRLKTQ